MSVHLLIHWIWDSCETVGLRLQKSLMAASVVIFYPICAAAESNLTEDQLA